MKPGRVIKINKEHDEKDFIRDLAIYLSTRYSTPADILDSKFGEVKEVENEYLLISGKSKVHYTCSIGYDKKVVRYDKNGHKKTETVTRWEPYSGEAEHTGTEIVGNADEQEGYRESAAVVDCYKTVHSDNMVELDCGAEININACELAKAHHIDKCAKSVKLPGDRNKDFSSSGSIEIKNTAIVYVPEYKTTYTYKGETCEATGFAAGDIQSVAPFPPRISGNVQQIAKKETKIFFILAIAAVIIGIVFFVLANIINALMGVGFFAIFAAVVLFIIYRKQRRKKERTLYRDIGKQKKELLAMFLEKNGMKQLSESELEKFDKDFERSMVVV